MSDLITASVGHTASAIRPPASRSAAIHEAAKRAIDCGVALFLLALLIVPMTVVAIAIALESPGPIFFRQPRVGRNGCLFLIWKFRTMHHVGADLAGRTETQRNDPRVTRLGMLLRKTSIDELPQLLNVLAGEMSLVGPRPHAILLNHRYSTLVTNYELRHSTKPGMTGWAQVNGWRGETRTLEQIRQRVAHDLYYVQRRSLAFDLWILARTVKVMLGSKKDVF